MHCLPVTYNSKESLDKFEIFSSSIHFWYEKRQQIFCHIMLVIPNIFSTKPWLGNTELC